MDPFADLWDRSGKNPQRLYRGSTEEIVGELRNWVERRKAHNNVDMDASWDMFRTPDSLQHLIKQSGGLPEEQVPAIMSQISATVAKIVYSLDRSRKLKQENNRETLLANFLLATLKQRGIRGPQMSSIERTQADTDVCALLGTMDPGFNAEMELEILENNTRVAQWNAELNRRNAILAQENANDPIPGLNTHSMGLVGARYRDETANNSTKSAIQALIDATNDVMNPGFIEFVMGRNSNSNASTPRRAIRARNDTVVYIADMLGNISIATGPSSGKAANMPANTNTAAASSPGNAAATADITSGAIGASSNTPSNTPDDNHIAAESSSTSTATPTNNQTVPGAESQGEGTNISKAKKKREGRKKAKAARAKEATKNAGTSVGYDDDDDDGKVPDLVDV